MLLITSTVAAQAAPEAADEGGDEEQTPDAAAKAAEAKQKEEAAKVAYTQAAKAAEGGNYEAALELYRKADELVPNPTPKFKVAVTLDKLERFADAKAAYEAFLDSKPDPDKYFSKIESARDRIKAILEMPSHIKVSTTPASPPNLVVAVDRVPQAGTEMVVMPGTHSLQVVADGFTGSATVMVGPAETKEVAITLVADRPVLTVPPPTAAPAPAPAPAQVIVAAGGPSRHEARTAAYVAFGLAGVEAIVGTVFAIQAVHEKNVYDASPSPANLASVDRQTAFADVFYATGLISVVGGVVLLLIDPADAPAAKPSDKK